MERRGKGDRGAVGGGEGGGGKAEGEGGRNMRGQDVSLQFCVECCLGLQL